MSNTPGTEKPMICNRCRHVSPAGSRFCNLCGQELLESASAVLGASAYPPPPSYANAQMYVNAARLRRSKAVAVLAAIGVFVFLTPVTAGACAIGGCFVTALSGGDATAIWSGAGLGVIASLAITVLIFRSMMR